MDKCDDCKHGQWAAKGTPSDTYTAEEVLAMMYNFATHITQSYGLHSNQLTDKLGRPVVLTVTPLHRHNPSMLIVLTWSG